MWIYIENEIKNKKKITVTNHQKDLPVLFYYCVYNITLVCTSEHTIKQYIIDLIIRKELAVRIFSQPLYNWE